MLKSQQLTRHSGISAETVDNPRLRGTELLEQPCNDVVGAHTVKHQRLVQLFGKACMEQRKLYLPGFIEGATHEVDTTLPYRHHLRVHRHRAQ